MLIAFSLSPPDPTGNPYKNAENCFYAGRKHCLVTSDAEGWISNQVRPQTDTDTSHTLPFLSQTLVLQQPCLLFLP
jgi:hypothetical protein